jgi:hypothetical protein
LPYLRAPLAVGISCPGANLQDSSLPRINFRADIRIKPHAPMRLKKPAKRSPATTILLESVSSRVSRKKIKSQQNQFFQNSPKGAT